MRLTIHANMYRLTRVPKVVRQARLGNITLVPASLLFQKERYMTVTSHIPSGSILIGHHRITNSARQLWGH